MILNKINSFPVIFCLLFEPRSTVGLLLSEAESRVVFFEKQKQQHKTIAKTFIPGRGVVHRSFVSLLYVLDQPLRSLLL